MSKVEEKTATLVLHLLGHQEKKLRASALEEKLRGLEAEEMAAILNFICNQAKGKDLAYLKAYNALPELFVPVPSTGKNFPTASRGAAERLL